KSYKNLQGLGQHESLIHSNYNIPWVGLIPQLLEAISKFKKTWVFLIQDKLKNGHQQQKQHVNVPCLERAYELLGQIFNNSNWGVCEYKNQQQTWVVL
ncbi:20001_t:CDS:2, partial [Dentiscutata erythropus]